MKHILTFSAIILSLNFSLAYADCSQFPQKNGPIVGSVILGGYNITVKADFKTSTGLAYGSTTEIVTSHTYHSPQFFIDDKRVNVTVMGANTIFKALKYDHVELYVASKASFFDKKPLLQGDLSISTTKNNDIIIDSEGHIAAYHAKCANWVY